MKYAIIIPDGAADEPLDELSGRTPLEAAHTPNMDRVAMLGRQGLARTVPDGFESGSDVATMCLLGYDPKLYHTGRAPLEAAAQHIPLSPADWVFRCNLVTVIDGIMKDHSAGGISNADARTLLAELANDLKLPGFEFHPGVSYRNLLVYRGPQEFDLITRPPHEIPEEPTAGHLPLGQGSQILRQIMDRSKELFANHPINQTRRKAGVNSATQVWFWGQGHAPSIQPFAQRFGIARGCMISGVDLLRGLAVLLGWDIHEVPGMTSFHDTDYNRQGLETAAMLDRYDLVFSHIEAPDEASHQADYKTKVAAIEHIDKYVVGPVLAKLQTFPDWRLMVLPDHPTNIATRKHGYAPTPFCMAGSNIASTQKVAYSERNAAAGIQIERGHELMDYFLRDKQATSEGNDLVRDLIEPENDGSSRLAASGENQKKADAFFNAAKKVAEKENYDYAIEIYLNGLQFSPDASDAHQALRDVSLKRKAAGGKDLSTFERVKFNFCTGDEKSMLNAEKLLCYDPGNLDKMVTFLQLAERAGCHKTVQWLTPIVQKAKGGDPTA